jgi:hypothetical protein
VGTATQTVAIVAMLVAGASLWSHARRDLDAVLTLLAVFLLGTAMCAVIYFYSAHEPGEAPQITALLAGILGLALGAATYRRQRAASDEFPNVLATRFLPTEIFETEGIQFAGALRPGGHRAPHQMEVYLQNGFDAPRDITIRFDAASSAQYVRVQREHRVTLGAAEVSQVTFPVVTPTYPGTYWLYISLAVAGDDGKRVRLWRAQDATERVKPATTVALLAVGHLAVGGGVRFPVGPLPDDLWNTALALPTQKTLWRPLPGTVPLHQ